MATFIRVVRNGQDSFNLTADGNREYRVGYTVVQNPDETPVDDVRLASSAVGLPAYLTSWNPTDAPPDPYAILQHFDVERPDQDAPYIYTVTPVWSTVTPDPEVTGAVGFPGGPAAGGGGGGQSGPTDNFEFLPKKVHWTHTPQTKLLERDLDGKAIQTAAGEKFDPVPELQKYRRTMVIQRYKTIYNSELSANYFDSTNEDEFEGAAPGRVRCIEFSAEDEFIRYRRLWNVRAVFEFEDHEGDVNVDGTPEKWSFEFEYVPHYGSQFLLNGNGPPRRVRDHSSPAYDFSNLKANGDLLPPGSEVQYRKFRVRKKMNFAAMGL